MTGSQASRSAPPGGGYLPSYAARSDHGCTTSPADCDGKPLKKHPSEYLRQLYFNSLVFTPEALRHLAAECGAGFGFFNSTPDVVSSNAVLGSGLPRAIQLGLKFIF